MFASSPHFLPGPHPVSAVLPCQSGSPNGLHSAAKHGASGQLDLVLYGNSQRARYGEREGEGRERGGKGGRRRETGREEKGERRGKEGEGAEEGEEEGEGGKRAGRMDNVLMYI